jgi:hypothetical protein
MRKSTIPFWAFVLSFVSANAAFAQDPPPYHVSGGIQGTLVNGHLQLHIEFMDWWQAPGVPWSEMPAGLDLYRRVVGFECSDYERINPEPFAFSWSADWYNPLDLDFLDTTTTTGNVYEYMIRAVDTNRDPVTANPDVSVGYVTNGEALIGHGQIARSPQHCGYPGSDFVHVPCPAECLPWFTNAPLAILLPVVDTGQTVRLYGQLFTGYSCEFGFDVGATITRVESGTCLVAVEAKTWSDVKHLYR